MTAVPPDSRDEERHRSPAQSQRARYIAPFPQCIFVTFCAGTLTWQLGEIWPTGGWGSVEYGTVGWLDGQVLGGRWKPLHHVMEQHLYRDVVAVCGADAACFVKNSNPLEDVFGQLHAVLFDIQTQKETHVASTYLAIGAGPAIHRFCLAEPESSHNCPPFPLILAKHQSTAASSVVILRLRVTSSKYISVSEENIVFIVPPANMTIPASEVSANVSQPHSCLDQPGEICSTVTCYRRLCAQVARAHATAAGVPSCGTSAGLIRHSVHEGAGQVSSERLVPCRRRTRCRISALGQAPRLAAAGHSQSGSSVTLSVMLCFALGCRSHRCVCIVAFNILAGFLWYRHMCKPPFPCMLIHGRAALS